MDAGGAALDLGSQRLLRRGIERAGLLARGLRIGGEAEAVELADVLAFHRHVAAGGDFGFHGRILSQPPPQEAGPAIDESLCQALVQGVG